MVFDIIMEDFRYKASLVVGSPMTKALTTIIHACKVSRETFRIALMIATLNDLEIELKSIFNAYVQALAMEKV